MSDTIDLAKNITAKDGESFGSGEIFTLFGDKLFFGGSSESFGVEPWFTEFANHLFFSANDGTNNNPELWVTDGTRGGTRLFQDINPGPTGSSPRGFVQLNEKLIFTASGGPKNASSLWEISFQPAQQVPEGSAMFSLFVFTLYRCYR